MSTKLNFIRVQNSIGAWITAHDKVIIEAVEMYAHNGVLVLAKKLTVAGIPDCVVFSCVTQGPRAMFTAYLKLGNDTILLNTMIRSLMAENDNAWETRVREANEKLFA